MIPLFPLFPCHCPINYDKPVFLCSSGHLSIQPEDHTVKLSLTISKSSWPKKKRKEKEKNIVFASLHCSNVSLCCSNTQVYRVCKYTMTSLLGVVTDSDLMRTSDYTVPCVARCGQRTTDLAMNHSFLSLVLNTRHVFSAAMGPSYQNQTSLLQR